MTTPAAGWYADPENDAGERYWHGTSWGEERRPRRAPGTQPPPPKGTAAYPLSPVAEPAPTSQSTAWAVAVALALAVIGLVVGYQPVTLLSGSGTLYIGLAIGAGGAVLAFAMRLRPWVRIIAVIAVGLVIANITVVEHQLTQRRHDIQQQLSNLGS